MKLSKFLLFLFFVLTASVAVAQSSAELKRKKEALQREIDLLQKNANKAANSKKLTLGEIKSLNAKIGLMQSKISVINSEIKNLDNQIHENTNTVHNLKGQLGQLKKEYGSMIRFAQRNKNAYDKMMFIFAASDFNQAYKRIKYLQQFGQYRKKQADYIQGKQKDLNYKIVILDKNLKEKSSLLHEQENEKNKLGKNKSEQSVVLNRFSKQERLYKQDIASKQKQAAQLERNIRSAIAREIALAKKKAEEEERLAAAKAKAENKPAPTTAAEKSKASGGYLTATPESAKLSAQFEGNRGSLPWPVTMATITQRFGKYKVGQAQNDNDGIDIETQEGAPVRAVFNGTVSTVNSAMGGYFVLIRHGQYFSVYSNLKSASVSSGQTVTTRQNIGVAGHEDGRPIVKFQIWRGTVPQNPEAWLGGK
ncbi:murein hydrolase activator EnvC family protein [Pedobacter frigoris]|uniref:Peptidase M23 n=1 Tax=Pedobacter frigoris TaxID=2571272 RepID=A0A4U1CBT4_9SPHI|nr:peptidoglycan DD-metalloendopeptidase family protein [Pedobacter frigoris]TKC04155.1 peptidase M23 [Pedobacter frigoris]